MFPGSVFAISPIHTNRDFPEGMTVDNKIDVFIARIEGWQLGIAKQIIETGIPHRGFALLHISFSYFEMLGKYLAGYVGLDQSRKYFKDGFKYTFTDVNPDDDHFLDTIYDSVRNGLFHVGMTRSNVWIFDGIRSSIGYNAEKNLLLISPDRFVDDLIIRFRDYSKLLKDPKNGDLRVNFEKRYDFDNS